MPPLLLTPTPYLLLTIAIAANQNTWVDTPVPPVTTRFCHPIQKTCPGTLHSHSAISPLVTGSALNCRSPADSVQSATDVVNVAAGLFCQLPASALAASQTPAMPAP